MSLAKQGIHPKKQIKKQVLKDKTIMDLVDDYLDEKRDDLSDYTKKDYKVRLANRMKPLLKVPVAELTVQDAGSPASCVVLIY